MTAFIRTGLLGLVLLGMLGCSADSSVVIPENPTPPPSEAASSQSAAPALPSE